MKVPFTIWSMRAENRTPIAINPARVDCIEQFSGAFIAATGEEYPAATKIIMMGKQEYIVQGGVYEVMQTINNGEKK